MSDSEYISEIGYLYGYYSELSPARMNLALLSKGVQHSVGRNPTYLELGFGQGLTLNINAAVSSGEFYGTDFNASQAAHAKDLAEASGRNVRIFDNSFEELLARDDLPDFDIISLHGIWSWVSEDSRQAIVDLIARKLKTGGLVYVSYNVTPGWSPSVPLRHLLSEYAARSATGGILSRVEQSIKFVDTVMDSGAAYFDANPDLKARLKRIKTLDPSYVAHEYFNTFWEPMPFSMIADRLADAKLSFGASANIIDNLESISISRKAREVLNTISDPVLRETTKDYFVNRQFRRDIYVKGLRKMSKYEMLEQINTLQFIRTAQEDARSDVIDTTQGKAELRKDVYDPIHAAILAQGHKPFDVQTIVSHDRKASITQWQVWEAMLILTSQDYVAPLVISNTPDEDRAASRRLNHFISTKAKHSTQMATLAAPVIGVGVKMGRIHQLFTLAMSEDAKDVPGFVWEILKMQNQKLVLKGQELETDAENLAQLKTLFMDFKKKDVPRLKAIGVI